MAIELPPTVTLKVRQTLAQWQHWDCATTLAQPPVLTDLLVAGRSNTSVRVASGAEQFVVRVDGVNPVQLGLNRSAEWRAHQLAAERGLAPRPVYRNPELGVLVSEFCQNDRQLLSGPGKLAAIADLLRNIHSLPAIKFRLQPLQRVNHYCARLGLLRPAAELLRLCQHLQTTGERRLCHNDLLQDNRLQRQGKLLAIDWEYAAMGDPWFDLAVICEGDQLAPAACDDLVHSYLQDTPTPAQHTRLRDNRALYQGLTQLWEQLTGL